MLFTTLIPVYKTQFIEDTVQCLKAQTLQNFQVIFSDDSPTQDLAEIIDELQAHEGISFSYRILQGRRIGPVTNCHDLLRAWAQSSPYIHFLLDDDLIFPDFYQAHEQAYKTSDAQACISSRIVVNEKKTPVNASPLPDFLKEGNERLTLLNLEKCVHSTLPLCNNWLGELSCATFSGVALQNVQRNQLHEIPYYGLNDLGLILEMLGKFPVAYIQNNLGAFRLNRWQTSRDMHSKIFQSTIISWVALIFDAHTKGWLSDQQLRHGLEKARGFIATLSESFVEHAALTASISDLNNIESAKNSFAKAWELILKGNTDYCTSQNI